MKAIDLKKKQNKIGSQLLCHDISTSAEAFLHSSSFACFVKLETQISTKFLMREEIYSDLMW